jgi:hypothetical protein
MRLLIGLLVLTILTPGAAAQQTPHLAPGADAPVRHLELSPRSGNPPPAVRWTDDIAEERSGTPATEEAAVLDAAFWRQILAGVIVAVVSTLILRVLL